MQLSRKTSTALSVIFGLSLLAIILWIIGPAEVLQQFYALGWEGFLFMILSIFISHLLWTISWFVIMKAHKETAPFSLCLWARIGSFAVSYLTPSMHFGGEPIRAMVIVKETGSSYSRVFATIVTERVTMMTTLVFTIMTGAILGIYTVIPTDTLIYLASFAVLLCTLVGLIILNFSKRLFAFTRFTAFLRRKLPWKSFLQRAENAIRRLEQETARSFGKHKKHTAGAFLISLVATILMVLRPQIYFYFSQGRLFSISDLTLIFAMTTIISAFFWITPGGIGVSEGGFIGIFAIFGISGSEAVAFSFSVKAVQWILMGVGISLLAHYGIINILFGKRNKEKGEKKQ